MILLPRYIYYFCWLCRKPGNMALYCVRTSQFWLTNPKKCIALSSLVQILNIVWRIYPWLISFSFVPFHQTLYFPLYAIALFKSGRVFFFCSISIRSHRLKSIPLSFPFNPEASNHPNDQGIQWFWNPSPRSYEIKGISLQCLS